MHKNISSHLVLCNKKKIKKTIINSEKDTVSSFDSLNFTTILQHFPETHSLYYAFICTLLLHGYNITVITKNKAKHITS
jgi:hypothetical protein